MAVDAGSNATHIATLADRFMEGDMASHTAFCTLSNSLNSYNQADLVAINNMFHNPVWRATHPFLPAVELVHDANNPAPGLNELKISTWGHGEDAIAIHPGDSGPEYFRSCNGEQGNLP